MAGVYSFRLAVTDNQSGIGADTVQVTILSNDLPEVNAEKDKILPLPFNSVTLSGTASDKDGIRSLKCLPAGRQGDRYQAQQQAMV